MPAEDVCVIIILRGICYLLFLWKNAFSFFILRVIPITTGFPRFSVQKVWALAQQNPWGYIKVTQKD